MKAHKLNNNVFLLYYCHRLSGVWADEYYTRRMMGEGCSYQERQQERVHCPECRWDLARGSLDAHRQTKNGAERGWAGKEGNKESRGYKTRTFRITFPAKAGTRPYPVEGCSGQAEMRTAM